MSSTLLQSFDSESQTENDSRQQRNDDWSETTQSQDTSSIVASNKNISRNVSSTFNVSKNDISKYGNSSFNVHDNDVSKYSSSFATSNSDISQHERSSYNSSNNDIPRYYRSSLNVTSSDVSQNDRSSFRISKNNTSKYDKPTFYASNSDISNPNTSVYSLEAEWNTTLEEQRMILAKFEEESQRSKKSATVIKRSKSVANANAPMISEIDSGPILNHHHDPFPILDGEVKLNKQVN